MAEWTLREHHIWSMIIASVLIALLILLPAPQAHDQVGASAITVVDGDTIKTPLYGTVRIMGLDTPETFRARSECEYQRGMAAKAELERLLSSGAVTLEEKGQDKYRRTLAIVRVDGRDVAQLMVASGHARPYKGGKRESWC